LDKQYGFIGFGLASAVISGIIIYIGAYLNSSNPQSWDLLSTGLGLFMVSLIFVLVSGGMMLVVDKGLKLNKVYAKNLYAAYFAISLMVYVAVLVFNLIIALMTGSTIVSLSFLSAASTLANLAIALGVTAIIMYLFKKQAKATFKN
jgi:hypothetical protein